MENYFKNKKVKMEKNVSPVDKPLYNNIKELNLNGEYKYNIEKIIKECNIKEGTQLIKYVSQILNEPKEDLIAEIYKELGKDFIISYLNKTLNIENNGGMSKLSSSQTKEKKSPGGVFFYLMKTNDPSVKSIIKKVFHINYKERNQRKKVYRQLDKLNL